VSTAIGPRAAPARCEPLSAWLGLSFVAAGGAAAVWNATERFEHGWWLVSFLVLVGGVAQLLFGAGRARLVPAAPGMTARWSGTRARVVPWNAGTLLVALGVMATARLSVVAGSVLLLWALAAMGGELRAHRDVTLCRRGSERAYGALLVFMAASTLIGAALAWDLAWV
jgi:hypothetical protein